MDNMCLFDDELMSRVFDDNIPAAKLIIDTVLEKDVEIKTCKGQVQLKNPLVNGRNIILDILAGERNGDLFNCEVQRRKRGAVYTENISIMVMSLKQVENASDEDRRYGRDKWAKLITAKTREEVEMIAKTDSYIEEAAETLLKLQSDYATLKYIQEREDFRQDERKREKKIREQENKIKDQDKQIQARDKQIQARDKKIQKQSRQLKQKDIELERYRAKYGELE